MSRIDHTEDFMQFVMTPPVQEREAYEQYQPKTSMMRVLSSKGNGKGGLSGVNGVDQLPSIMPVQGMFSGNEWVMPVVIIVVSAMALMTLYAVLSKRR